MFPQKLLALLLAASPLAHSRVLPRDIDYLDEGIMLAHCRRRQRGATAPFGGAIDRVIYNHYVDALDSQSIKAENPYNPTTPGGSTSHIDWTAGTYKAPITATIGDKKFEVWDLKRTGDPKTNRTGQAKLDGQDMYCYIPDKYILDRWATALSDNQFEKVFVECEGKYVCTRTNRKVRRTEYEISESSVAVTISLTQEIGKGGAKDPLILEYIQDAFSELYEVYNPASMRSTGKATIKSGDANLEFSIAMAEMKGNPRFDPLRVLKMKDHLVKEFAPKLAAQAEFSKCNMVMGSQYPTCDYKIQFPSSLYVTSQLADQADMEWQPKDQVVITTKSTKKNFKCEQNRKGMEILRGVFVAAGALSEGWISGVASGLGFVFGSLGPKTC